ncbi:hypothetical protein BaOVIS_013360 [Babesia ovis]|uniref:Uncharacterized protein n=1 Tax=Babesia ovis TaxID=5869 RepID=A0A9W5T9P7_BABOV|nr:hypothetical protein BaOVIS_013360 [Babesia ovis]
MAKQPNIKKILRPEEIVAAQAEFFNKRMGVSVDDTNLSDPVVAEEVLDENQTDTGVADNNSITGRVSPDGTMSPLQQQVESEEIRRENRHVTFMSPVETRQYFQDDDDGLIDEPYLNGTTTVDELIARTSNDSAMVSSHDDSGSEENTESSVTIVDHLDPTLDISGINGHNVETSDDDPVSDVCVTGANVTSPVSFHGSPKLHIEIGPGLTAELELLPDGDYLDDHSGLDSVIDRSSDRVLFGNDSKMDGPEVPVMHLEPEVETPVEMSTEASFGIYENLNTYGKLHSRTAERNALFSGVDSNSDYKTAMDDDDFANTDFSSAVIDIPQYDDISQDQLTMLTDSFKDTMGYMTNREILRYYTKEMPRCSLGTCAGYTFMFIGLMCTAILVGLCLEMLYWKQDQIISVRGARQICVAVLIEFCVLYPMLVATFLNLKYWGSKYIYYKVVTCTIMFSMYFTITYIAYLVSIFVWNNQDDCYLGMGWLLNVNHNICIGKFCSYNLVLLLYKIFILCTNIWVLSHRFIMPRMLSSFVMKAVTKASVVSIDRCNIAVPNHPIRSEVHGTTSDLGYMVNIEQSGYISSFWALFCRGIGTPGTYQYVGQLNRELKPHGYGLWQGTTSYGEVLIGYWESGIPLGTFRSVENNTGAKFSQMVLGWVKCRTGGSIAMGIAAVETCTNSHSYSAFPRVMKYKAELFDEDNITEGLVKHPSTQGSTYSDDGQSSTRTDEIILRLYKIGNDYIPYDFSNCSAYIHDLRKPRGAQGRIKSILCNMLLNRPGVRQLNRVFNTVFKTLERNMPIFVTNEGTEITVSVDSSLNLYVNGFVPFDVTFDNDMSPVASKVDPCISLKVEDNYTIVRRGSTKPPLLRRSVEPSLAINGWKRRGAYRHPEVCVYIHGHQMSNERRIQNIAQLYTCWDYPQYLKPMFFEWPPVCNMTKVGSSKYHSALESTKQAFERFLNGLVSTGATDVHLVVERSGSATFLETFLSITESSDSGCIFRRCNDFNTNTRQLNLLSITLMFPECDIDRFVNFMYQPLRIHCNIVTIYGYNVPKMWYWSSSNNVISSSIYNMWSQSDILNDSIDLQAYDAPRTLGSILMPPVIISKPSTEMVASLQHKTWLDIDCIDVTWLLNVTGGRNANWHLFREIAEDLKELIIDRKRAKDRITKLDHIVGNVWSHVEGMGDEHFRDRYMRTFSV